MAAISAGLIAPQTHFTSQTATIYINDIGDVGELQSLSIEENFDLRPVPEIGKSNITTYVPGVFKGMCRAQRGVIDLDAIYQKLLPQSDVETMKSEISSVLASSKVATFSLNGTIENIFDSTMKNNRLTHILTFNIDIKDIDDNIFMRLENCMINTRKITMSVNQVLILQDLEIVYQKRSN